MGNYTNNHWKCRGGLNYFFYYCHFNSCVVLISNDFCVLINYSLRRFVMNSKFNFIIKNYSWNSLSQLDYIIVFRLVSYFKVEFQCKD